MNREEVLKEAIGYYRFRISEIEKKVSATRNKAAKSPGAMESWSDKSKDEFTQLADGLTRELKPLRESVKALEAAKPSEIIEIGSIVSSGVDYYLIVPSIGGDFIKTGGEEIFLLSAQSELGKLLLGKRVKDTIDWRGKSFVITSIL